MCYFYDINLYHIRLSDLRSQKQKLSRQVRDKEEELETAMQKIDTLRQDLRKAEKQRRDVGLGGILNVIENYNVKLNSITFIHSWRLD